MTDINNLLPIGTVVSLKGAEKRLMIFGIKQMDANNQEQEYDYIGVIYPEGHLGANMQFLFNHEDIESIFHLGYEDIERQIFINKLSEIYAKTTTTSDENK